MKSLDYVGAFFYLSTMEFPIYRQLGGFKRYYKIVSLDLFHEAYPSAQGWTINTIEALQFPEKLRIKDMIEFQFSYLELDKMEAESIFQNLP